MVNVSSLSNTILTYFDCFLGCPQSRLTGGKGAKGADAGGPYTEGACTEGVGTEGAGIGGAYIWGTYLCNAYIRLGACIADIYNSTQRYTRNYLKSQKWSNMALNWRPE